MRPPLSLSMLFCALAMLLTACTGAGSASIPAPTSASVPPSVGPGATESEVPPPSPSPSSAAGLVSIGERSLWLECVGEGEPTVVLESGLGGDHRTWERVQPALAAATRVCTYDRAGIGESDSANGSRTAGAAVDDLAALLTAAEIEPPYVLVGFSFGGAIAQLYAATHPDEVAGIVLVESNHPLEAVQFEQHLTAEQIEADRAAAGNNPEGIDPVTSLEEVADAGPLPDVPLVVVTAGQSEGWPPGWDGDTFDELRAAQQEDLSTLTTRGRQVIAHQSGHHVPSQQPEVIVDAVRSVLAEIEGER